MSDFIYNLPPEGKGTPEQQLEDMRNFLVRTVRQLNSAETQSNTAAITTDRAALLEKAQSSSATTDEKITVLRSQASALRDLIVKTSDNVYSKIEEITTTLESDYESKSDFGDYKESVKTTIEQTAKETIERYDFQAQINAAVSGNAATQSYVEKIQGQIRRGFITIGGTTYFGIAIGEQLTFTGTEQTVSGETYYELKPEQNLGLYTAQGWYFFAGERLLGYFDAEDHMLHVDNITVSSTIQMGEWMISTSGGFGIRYIGD